MERIPPFNLEAERAVLGSCLLDSEALNTAVETVVDLVSPEFHPLAGRAKDIAAAAVWVLSVLVAVVGVLVFANAILN